MSKRVSTLSDEVIEQKIEDIIELVEEEYGDEPLPRRMAVLIDTVIAKHGVTWYTAYLSLSRVIAKYGYEASVQCGEIDDEETADKFHQDGQVVLGYNQQDGDEQ